MKLMELVEALDRDSEMSGMTHEDINLRKKYYKKVADTKAKIQAIADSLEWVRVLTDEEIMMAMSETLKYSEDLPVSELLEFAREIEKLAQTKPLPKIDDL